MFVFIGIVVIVVPSHKYHLSNTYSSLVGSSGSAFPIVEPFATSIVVGSSPFPGSNVIVLVLLTVAEITFVCPEVLPVTVMVTFPIASPYTASPRVDKILVLLDKSV